MSRAALCSLFVLVLALGCGERGSEQPAPEQAPPPDASTTAPRELPGDLAASWPALRAQRDRLAAQVDSGKLDGVGELCDQLSVYAGLVSLHSSALDAQAHDLVDRSAKTIDALAMQMRYAPDALAAQEILRKIDRSIRMIEIQHPAGSLPGS